MKVRGSKGVHYHCVIVTNIVIMEPLAWLIMMIMITWENFVILKMNQTTECHSILLPFLYFLKKNLLVGFLGICHYAFLSALLPHPIREWWWWWPFCWLCICLLCLAVPMEAGRRRTTSVPKALWTILPPLSKIMKPGTSFIFPPSLCDPTHLVWACLSTSYNCLDSSVWAYIYLLRLYCTILASFL